MSRIRRIPAITADRARVDKGPLNRKEPVSKHGSEPDTLIYGSELAHREQIARVLELRGHAAYRYSNIADCRRLLDSPRRIDLVVVPLTPALDPLKPLHEIQEFFRKTRVSSIPHFIAVSYLQRTAALEASLLPLAHAVFGPPALFKSLAHTTDLVDYLRAQPNGGISVEIFHTCTLPPTQGCLRGASVAKIEIKNQLQQPHLVKGGFKPLLLWDCLLRFTSEAKPKRIEQILDDMAASSFYSHWLQEEHINRRWFITNFSRLREAISAHCVEHLFTPAEDAFLRSETYTGKTTVYYSTATWHLTHENGGPSQAA